MSSYFWTGEPTINLIAAVAVDGSIGAEGKLLWKIKADLAYYKARTYGNVIIMGETTFDTLPKVALIGRTTVVVSEKYSKNPIESKHDDAELIFASNPNQALHIAKAIAYEKECDVYVAGGASIYEQLLGKCEYAFITWVDKEYKPYADKFFPLDEFNYKFELISESGWQDDENMDVGIDQLDEPNHKFTAYKNIFYGN